MTTVLYHSADFDGIFCREIAKKFLGTEGVTYIGWNFGDAPLQIPNSGTIYVLDLPLDVTFGGKAGEFNLGIISAIDSNRLLWIDHHASAIKTHPPEVGGYRIDGVAACRLAWQWFKCKDPTFEGPLAIKEDFVARIVVEPLAVRLAGEYDIWDHRGDGDLEFQFGLRSVKDIESWFPRLLSPQNIHVEACDIQSLLDMGKVAMVYSADADATTIKHHSYLTEWEGMKLLTLNTARCNSLTFGARDVPETGHDALLAYYFNGKCWTVSLYHAKHRKDLDLSLIAVKYGGGGHRGACGFTCQKLPFMP